MARSLPDISCVPRARVARRISAAAHHFFAGWAEGWHSEKGGRKHMHRDQTGIGRPVCGEVWLKAGTILVMNTELTRMRHDCACCQQPQSQTQHGARCASELLFCLTYLLSPVLSFSYSWIGSQIEK